MRSTCILLMLAVVLACSGNKKEKETPLDDPTTRNDLPDMRITFLEGGSVNARSLTRHTILILFQPDCDHCQHEAQDIEKNLAAFRDHELYFVSSSAPAEVKKFADDHKLAGIPNIKFGMTTVQSILDNFGPIQAPSIYIYSEGRLVKQFNGQTEVGEIMKYL